MSSDSKTLEMMPEFGFERARQFVDKNAYALRGAGVSLARRSMRCIDDRDMRTVESGDLPDLAIPGAGLGVVMDVLAAVSVAEGVAGGEVMKGRYEDVYQAASSVLGVIDFHTDDSHKDDPLACAGCGYCAGSLKNPAKMLMSADAAQFAQEKVILTCVAANKQAGKSPVTYSGPHRASAVMILTDQKVGLPSTGVSGEHVYVYSAAAAAQILEAVATEFYKRVVGDTPGALTLEQWVATVRQAASQRASEVLSHLAAGLPRFMVDENLTVTEVSAASDDSSS